MAKLRRRSVRATAAVVVLAVVAAVTLLPTGPRPAREPITPTTVTAWSSTRGVLHLTVPEVTTGGAPWAPPTTESVLGADGRRDLSGAAARYPNSAIGRLDLRQGDAARWCTGTLIGPATVLTAGHCVHDGISGPDGWSTRVRFLPGVVGNRTPFGACGAVELVTLPGWYEAADEAADLAVVVLDCSIGHTVGWFGYEAVPGGTALAGTGVSVRGYPGDQRWGTLWTMRDRIRVSRARLVFYAADTYAGQSGAAVWARRACGGGTGPCALAVHAYGVHDDRGPADPHARYNHGPRLDAPRVALLAALGT